MISISFKTALEQLPVWYKKYILVQAMLLNTFIDIMGTNKVFSNISNKNFRQLVYKMQS